MSDALNFVINTVAIKYLDVKHKYTNSLVNVDTFYENFQKSPIPQLTKSSVN